MLSDQTIARRRVRVVGTAGRHRPLRILMVTEAFLGGVATHLWELCKQLRLSGHTVHLIYSPARLDQNAHRRVADLEDRGVRCRRLDIEHELSPSDVVVIRKLRQEITASGPFDVVHAHSTKAGALLRVAAIGLRCGVVYTPHGWMTLNLDLPAWKRSLAGKLERALSLCTDAVITLSEVERSQAAQMGIAEKRLCKIPNGLSETLPSDEMTLQRQTSRRNLGVAVDDICIGFVGRLAPEKRPGDLIDAFHKLSAGVRQRVFLVMCGTGPRKNELESKARALGLESRIRWLGEVRTAAILPALDILALPSLYEGFPYAVLEAMQTGLPVVMTEVGGSEMVLDKITGYRIPCGDVLRLASALTKLVVNPDLRRAMGSESRRRGLQFTSADMSRKTVAVYRTAAKDAENRRKRPGRVDVDVASSLPA
jgi:glycosyltransferase involved in cell wall biosynthesis